jgi:hypothetical protein
MRDCEETRPLPLCHRRNRTSSSETECGDHPSLERVEGTPDRLDEILAPSKRALPAF